MSNLRKISNIVVVFLAATISLTAQEKDKTLIDFFLPMSPQGKLVSEGIWGVPNVLPRDIKNGLEDSTMKKSCYWDGKIVRSDDGKYHMYASRWDQSFSHSDGWHLGSKGVHAVSDNIMGPYIDKGLLWPQWKEGMGHNVIGLRMHDGRYATITSEITDGEVFVSKNPEGPFELLGKIEVDPNGFDKGLARYQNKTKPSYGQMSNVGILLRPDGRYMLVGRSTAPMISDNGILGPYKIMGDRVYKNYPELPQDKNEDPTLWYSGGLYHIVYNNWPSKTSHHFTSDDGLHNWTYRGIAFNKEAMVFKYTDGTVNNWEYIERPTAYVENGHVTHFMFSVIDVGKGQDKSNDNHGSKIIVVPFDGNAFDEHMQKIIKAEKKVKK
ncbi:glycoside hydrolase family protein [Flavobacterium sp.]|uniref:glycoside hydrolase family protein n=1 Tax=Flavobacterium sp. TaxID=239 RepID=UPI003C5A7278